MVNKIESMGLSEVIKEMRLRCLGYSKMLEELKTKHNVVDINKMDLCRFFKKVDYANISTKAKDIPSGIDDFKHTYKSNISKTLEDIQDIIDNIQTILANTNMPKGVRSDLEKMLNNRLGRIKSRLLDDRESIYNLIGDLDKNYKNVNTLLVEFSALLCSDCRKSIAKLIENESNRRKSTLTKKSVTSISS
ncbi:MAG: hypothetical protein NT038_07975 [Euryarchaeota archaeon]|nr:hypothetical protein [Euryarchaeota archaeon]